MEVSQDVTEPGSSSAMKTTEQHKEVVWAKKPSYGLLRSTSSTGN